MEKCKQLNLSAPLLSVRRNSSPRAITDGLDRKVIEKSQRGRQPSLPVNQAVVESESVAKPASVPFLWENAPGRSKGECKTRSSQEPSITPRLPPGRLSNADRRSGEVYSQRRPPGRFSNVRHKSSELFNPRLLPGRLSGEVYSQRLPLGRLSTGRPKSGELCNPRPPPGRISGEVCHPKFYPARLTAEVCTPKLRPGRLSDVRWRSGEVQTQRHTSGRLIDSRHLSGEVSSELNISKYKSEALVVTDHASLLESLKESLNADVESGDDSEEDSFSDALDTLSPTESLSLNCSLSGLGNFDDGPNCVPSAAVSFDPQARDLMMRRFLTAAKAAVVETPQYVSRKQSAVTQEPKMAENVISLERKMLIKQPGFDPAPIHNKYNEDVTSEYEDDFEEPKKRIGKGCGIFPRLCLRNSSSILHQGSESKSKTQPSTPSRGEVKKLTRNYYSTMKLKTQTSSQPSGEVKKLNRNAFSGPLDKCASDAFYKKNYHSGFLSQELHKVDNKLMDGPKRVSSSGELYKMAENRSSSTQSRSGAISPYRNERSPSPFREGARFLGLPREVEQKAEKISSLIRRDKILLEVSSLRSHKQGSEPSGNSVEKILYADTEPSKATPNINEERSLIYLSRKSETMSRSDCMIPHSVARSSGEFIKHPLLEKGGGENLESVSLGNEHQKSVRNQLLEQENSSLGFKELKGDGNLILKKTASNKEQISQTENSALELSHLPPPLPKSPSESWLWRTLPSISLRNPFSHSRGSPLDSKKQSQKQQSPSPKWESMVKSSKVHHDHVRYSEELVSHIPHQHDRR